MIKKISKEIKHPKKLIVKKRTARVTKHASKPQIYKSWLTKAEQNPIISPKSENNWESWQTFNPGVILLNDKIHFLYRAIGEDSFSRFGYASSQNGFIIDERLTSHVYEHNTNTSLFHYASFASGGSWGGSEDPRLVRVNGEDVLYMVYTVCDHGLRMALTSISINDFLQKKWEWKSPILISPPEELHKNWVIFPEKINGKYAILHRIIPNIEIAYLDDLDFNQDPFIHSLHLSTPQKNNNSGKCWDKQIRGPGAPPLKTKEGWLLFYHAMDHDWSKYKVGVMLLDINDPTKILHRAKNPVLVPDELYENNGFKSGIVFVSGAVIKDENLLIYYGCSDSYVSVAYANLNIFLEALEKDVEPKLKVKMLKQK